MSLQVGTFIIGGFLPEKEAVAKELGEQHSSSVADPNFPYEEGKPRCMPNLLTDSFIIFLLVNVLGTYV
jgi:hypothetical protein